MFRIYCTFKPNVKRASGGDAMGPRQGRGAWVVTHCAKTVDNTPLYVWHHARLLGVASKKARQPGTRCNPRKLLAERQRVRHA